MRIGTSLRSAYLTSEVRQGARLMIEQAVAARDGGLDSLFVGDHHVTGIAYYQNVPILGRLLAEWGDSPAGALFLLPLWHPVLLAEQVGTLASLAPGRFVVQCAIGDGDAEFAGMGERLSERAARFEASIGIVRRLLAGERVTTGVGEPWQISGAATGPLPPEPVEFWIGGSARRAVERAARLGDAWIAGPEHPLEVAAEQLGIYRESCARYGTRPRAVLRRDVHVGADDEEAERVAGPVVAAGYRGFPAGATIHGGPAAVAGRFDEIASVGFEEVLVRHLVDDQREVLSSFARLAEVRRLTTR